MIVQRRYTQYAKKDIFMIHGLLGRMEQWDVIIPYIPDEYNIYCIELPGHNGNHIDFSGGIEEYIERLGNELKDICDKEVVIIGQSVGGLMALELLQYISYSGKAVLINVATKQRVENPDKFLQIVSSYTEVMMYRHMKKMFSKRVHFLVEKSQVAIDLEAYYIYMCYIIKHNFSELSKYIDVNNLYVVLSKRVFGHNIKKIMKNYGYNILPNNHCYIINSKDFFINYISDQQMINFILGAIEG